MGLFQSYNKPGKGIDENAPPKRRFFMFFELLFRKLSKLILLNLMYFITIIPSFILLTIVSEISLGVFFQGIEFGEVPFLGTIFAVFLICVWGAGPVTAGFTYIIRNYGREEHAWIWSDFWENTRKNFKQAIIVFAVDLVFLYLFFVAVTFYGSYGGMLFSFVNILMLIFFVIYTFMHLYIYPMMITFKLPLRALYKNAFIFALLRFPQNVLIMAFIFAILWVGLGNSLFMLITIPLILFSLCGYIGTFWTYPTLQKYMIKSDDTVKPDYD